MLARILACAPALLLVLSADASPSYTRLKLFQLAGRADVIVAGRILDLDAQTFVLAVDEALAGEPDAYLRVRRFEDWTCHGRWSEYAVGQRALLFLRRDADEPHLYCILGAGDEGELPFVGSDVVVEHTHSYRVRGYEVAEHVAADAPITGSRVPFHELASAIRGYRNLFWYRKQEPRDDPGRRRGGYTRWFVGLRGSEAELRAFVESSSLARHLVEEARSSQEWIGPTPRPGSLLDPSRSRRLRGESPSALAFVGDVDGDGIGDLASVARSAGEAGEWLTILLLDGAGGVRRRSTIGSEILGSTSIETQPIRCSVAGLGDLDGDSVPDLLAGVPGWSGTAPVAGGAWVVLLRRDATVGRAVELGSTEPMRAAGVDRSYGLGTSLARVGDLDGNGTLEVAIGQWPMLSLEDFMSGRARRMGKSLLILSLARDAGVAGVKRIHSRGDGFTDDFSWLGAASTGLGDVDGDGIADLAVSDPNDDDGGKARGAVWVVFLTPDGTVEAKQKISDWTGGFDGVLGDEARFGSSLAGAGDLDGDGVPDLLVGSEGCIWTLLLREDGTVREHRRMDLLPQNEGGPFALSDVLAVERSGAAGAPLVAVGGWEGEGSSRRGLIWWLRAEADGRLLAW